MVEALRQKPEGSRLALVVEGGGMRGAVSGGMALGLDELGLADSFDAVYGASAGTLNGMWLLSGRIRDGIPTWTDPGLNRELIGWSRVVRRRPVVDVRRLVEKRYEQLSPGLFEAVLAAKGELHPLATEVGTGKAVDLWPSIKDGPSLRKAIRASATLPLLAGAPVEIGDSRFVDAGLSAAIPFRAALADGATHILILRSRRSGEVVSPATGMSARVMSRALSRIDPSVARAFLSRPASELLDEEQLSLHDREPLTEPHILSVRPAPGSAAPSRLERDVEVVKAGLEAGRQAVHAALGD